MRVDDETVNVSEFWARVDRHGESECWPWKGSMRPSGYGRFWVRDDKHVRHGGAHRIAYQLVNGRISDDAIVMHSCDNPRCVNPSHLSAGTHQDNTDDCIAKGRFRPGINRGAACGQSKLTEDHVYEIRLRVGKETYRRIAADYGVTNVTVRNIATRHTWRNLPEFDASHCCWFTKRAAVSA